MSNEKIQAELAKYEASVEKATARFQNVHICRSSAFIRHSTLRIRTMQMSSVSLVSIRIRAVCSRQCTVVAFGRCACTQAFRQRKNRISVTAC